VKDQIQNPKEVGFLLSVFCVLLLTWFLRNLTGLP
jgi:hypothetical protein